MAAGLSTTHLIKPRPVVTYWRTWRQQWRRGNTEQVKRAGGRESQTSSLMNKLTGTTLDLDLLTILFTFQLVWRRHCRLNPICLHFCFCYRQTDIFLWASHFIKILWDQMVIPCYFYINHDAEMGWEHYFVLNKLFMFTKVTCIISKIQ